MTGAGIAKSNVSLLRAKFADQRHFSKLRGTAEFEKSSQKEVEISRSGETKMSMSSWRSSWVPDPRTGIYIPKGHEWVMDDVPKEAASLNQTFWLRNVDGVLEKPDPDTAPEHYYQMHM